MANITWFPDKLLKVLIILPFCALLAGPLPAQINEDFVRALSMQSGSVILPPIETRQQPKQIDNALSRIKSEPAARLMFRQWQHHGLTGESVLFSKYSDPGPFSKSDPAKMPFVLTQKNGDWLVSVLMKVAPGSGSDLLAAFGARNVTEVGDILTARVPLSQLGELSLRDEILFIETASKRKLQNREGRISINANLVHSGVGLPQAYQGEGVIMGVIDSGIDFSHPDFSNENGSRIQYLYEYTGSSELEWTKLEIDTQTHLVTQRDSDDGMGHGTHVTGTAAGGGIFNSQYTGIAPKSDIIFVKGMVDGGFSDADVVGGCQYIFNKADQLGKSAVINLSLGSNFGPIDGSSLYEQALSSLVGPGRIIVAAAGNQGFDLIHAGGVLPQMTRHATFLLADNPSSSLVNMWFKAGALSQVAVAAFVLDQNQELLFLGSSNFVTAGTFMDYEPIVVGQTVLGYVGVDAQTTADPRNGDGNILIEILGDPQNNVNINEIIWLIVYDSAGGGQFDMWSFGGDFWPSVTGIASDFPGVVEIPGNANMTVGTPASAHKVLSVGSYVTTNTWTSFDNQVLQWQNPDPTRQNGNPVIPELGQKSYFSSVGPTRDGRIAPDISAPGELIFSPLSSHLTVGQGYQRELVLQGGMYVGSQGTSMASPHVAGVIALMLQINPNLDYDDVFGIFSETARIDGFTGSVPNNRFGTGKIDAYEAVSKTLGSAGPGEPSATLRYFDPNSEQRLLVLDFSTPIDSGFVFGTNRFLDRAKASVFTLPVNSDLDMLQRVNVWFGYRKSGLTSESYSISVYEGTAATGPAGPPLATRQYLLREVNADESFNVQRESTMHIFDEPVPVPASFFVSVEFDAYDATGIGNTAIMATDQLGRRVPEIWEMWSDGTWHNLSDAWFGQAGSPGNNGWHMWMEAVLGTSVDASDDRPDNPIETVLAQNYPNPFNPETRILFTLKEADDVSLVVYDLLGRQVARLVNAKHLEAGNHTVSFSGWDLSSGVYFYQLQTSGSVHTRKMTLLK
jgi:minor extracellular serine protease Vpr